MGVKGPHTQVKCLLEALIFGTCKKNIIMYSQMRFQLYQSHSLTVTGLKIKAATILRLLGNETIQFNTRGKKSEPGLRKQLNVEVKSTTKFNFFL